MAEILPTINLFLSHGIKPFKSIHGCLEKDLQHGVVKTRGFAPLPYGGFGLSEMLNTLPTEHPTSCQELGQPILRFFSTGVTFGN